MANTTQPGALTTGATTATNGARIAAAVGRALIVLAVLALLGAWLSELTDGTLFGLSQQHLFLDAIALTGLGIALLVDALLHARRL